MSKEWILPAFENDNDVLIVNSNKSSITTATRRKRPARKSIHDNLTSTGN